MDYMKDIKEISAEEAVILGQRIFLVGKLSFKRIA